MNSSALRLAWLGSADGGCARLLERVAKTCLIFNWKLDVTYLQHGNCNEQVICDAARAADRIVIPCETRLDYPWQTINALQSLDASVPWGVVAGVWLAGSRRTGVGATAHWQLPWYRWWDGWRGWFFPELASSSSLCWTQFEAVTVPIDLATPSRPALPASSLAASSSRDRKLLIVAACRETATTWGLEAERAGWNYRIAHPSDLTGLRPALQQAEAMLSQPDCILWDDSCHDRMPTNIERIAQSSLSAADDFEQALAQCRLLKQRYADAPLIAALALGHLAHWPRLQTTGVDDFFIKPSHALPLAEYLRSLAA